MRPSSLAPYPGSKRAKKYAVLNPAGLPHCEPFMGGAAIALKQPSPILGEINPAMRQIALVGTSKKLAKEYVNQYQGARQRFIDGVDVPALLTCKGQKQSQKLLKDQFPDEYDELTQRWHQLASECFIERSAGLYSFMQRSCFGNVMRLNPKGTAYNVSWHIEKLANALLFDPSEFALGLQGWKPKVLPTWQKAIFCGNRKGYLLLDPPYWVDSSHKMTPCYPGHKINEDTYDLAVEPLKEGMRRGFSKIHLCNYWSEKLEQDIVKIALASGYSIAHVYQGSCNALGHSNGRYQHGNRVDHRPKPIEVIWEFRPAKQLTLF